MKSESVFSLAMASQPFTCFHVEKNWAKKVHLWRKNDKYEVCLRGWNNPFEKALRFDEYGRPSGQQSMILGLMNEVNKSRNQIHLSRSNLGQFWKMFVEQKNVFTEPIIHQNQPSYFSAFIIVREIASSQLITQTNYTSPSIYKDYKTYFAWLWIIIFQDSTKKFQKWHPKQCSAKCELFTDVFLPTISEKTYLKICVLIYHSQKIALSQFLSDRSETM